MSTITISDNRLTTFYQQNPNFDILHVNLSDQAALSKLNLQGLDQTITLDLLKKYQRLLRLNPDPKVAMALLGVSQPQSTTTAVPTGSPPPASGTVLVSVGQPAPQPSANGTTQSMTGQPAPQTPVASTQALDSAQAIAAIPRTQFVQQFAPVVGGAAAAQQIHQDAATITAKTMLLWANVQNLVASPYFRATQVNNVDTSVYQFENLPNYQELFGSLDYCSCDECGSIFGPAAYLVDLLRITDQYVTASNAATIAQNFKLDERRPDLAQIELTCANTNDLVSYLDIVNNVLAIKAAKILQPGTTSQPDLTQAINTAYTALSTATYPFNLPFNLPLEQIRSYLGQLNTSLATLYRTFNAPQEAIAREALGLSLEEYTLITTPKPAAADLTNVYGLTVSASDLGGLANQDMFLKQTGLARQDLQDLLTQNLSANELSSAAIPHSFYINQLLATGQHLYLTTDGSNTISNLDLPTLDRLQRFIRLASKLNWSFADLDWVLHSLQVGEINADTIQSLAKVKQVQARLNLPLNMLSSFWYDLKTIGVGASGPSQTPFDLIFNNPQLLGRQAPYHPQYQDAHGQPLNPLYIDPVLKTPDANGRIVAGLRVSLDDLAALVAAFGTNGQMDFTVQNLSILFRHSQLAALVRLPINQYLLLLRLTNKLQPVFALDDLLYLFEIVDWLRTSGFTVYELDYILHGTISNYVASKYQDQNIPPFLQSLQALSINPPLALTVQDITDWTGLLQQLNNPMQPGPRQRIWSLLPTNIQQMIAQTVTGTTALTNQQMADFISALNTILLRPDFYQQAAFASLAVPQRARDLLQSGVILSENELLKLNRLFLAAAYPLAIAQSAVGQIDDEWKERLIQQLATFVGSTTDRVEALMEVIARNLTTPAGIHSYIEVFMYQSQAVGSQTYIQQALMALSRGLVLVEKLQLTSTEIDSVRTAPASYGFPTNLQQITIDNLRSLSTFKQLTLAFQDTQNQLIGYFANPAPATLTAITGWSEEQINEAATGHFQNMPQLLTSVDGLAMLKKAFDLSASLGVNLSFHEQILPLATLPAQANWTTYTSAADAVINTVKAKYNNDDWAKVSDTLNATLNEEKRSALAGFVLWKLGLNNLRTLTEYLLIDVETTGCASISLIKQAILSIQMYLQRCRLNLEPGVTAVNIPDVWWEWLLSYGIWQANRKVFLYPENYLDPGLRKSKSDLFQALESELLQSPITQESVEAAYQSYFEKFAELAKLKIAASYRCFVPQSGGQDALDTLFLFARTASEPATYYYRECQDPASNAPTWTAWSKIDVNISADYISPVFAFNKLFVFWVEITQTRQSAVNNNQTQHTTVQKATIKYIFQTESKKWTQPQTLAKDVIIDATSTDPTVPDFHIDTERLFWKKAYPLAITEADTQQEKILVMFGDVPNLPSMSPALPSSTPGQDADITQFDLQLYAAQQQGYLANQGGTQGYGSRLPAVTLSSDAATENKFLLLPQTDSRRTTVPNGLSQARNDLAAASVNNLALFAGGYDSGGSGFSSTVDIYNAASGQWSTSKLSQARTTLTATAVGNLALFAGGEGTNFMASSLVDIYNATTGQWSTAQLSQARQKFAATSVSNLALFAGGLNNNASGNVSDVVDIYNATSGQWSTAKLSQARTALTATSVGNLAFFAGGIPTNGASDVVDIYNATTGQWSTAKLSQPRSQLAATSVGNLALFAGGVLPNGASDVVDIYNATSGQWSTAKLSQTRLSPAAASAGNLVLFAGGSSSSIVDTFSPINATSSIIGVIDGTTFATKTVDTALHANYLADSDRSLLNHLMDYWPLDEGSGTTIDDRA
ncbi:MAG TPA: neuraminidase-like domain-containing protein, partial [Ktedonobacteraceae bacterium]|nr:neuraminidase-like domain-containing protein [Ktedonobacteraceae bacterium]